MVHVDLYLKWNFNILSSVVRQYSFRCSEHYTCMLYRWRNFMIIGIYNCLYFIQGMTEDPCWRWLFPVQTSSPPTQRSLSVWWGCPRPWRTPVTWLIGSESNRSAHFCCKQFVFLFTCDDKWYLFVIMIEIKICIELKYYMTNRFEFYIRLNCHVNSSII